MHGLHEEVSVGSCSFSVSAPTLCHWQWQRDHSGTEMDYPVVPNVTGTERDLPLWNSLPHSVRFLWISVNFPETP